MDARMKDSGGGTVVRENVCPRCGRPGGVVFWKSDKQKDLMGKTEDVAVKLGRPRCRKCGDWMGEGEDAGMFQFVRDGKIIDTRGCESCRD